VDRVAARARELGLPVVVVETQSLGVVAFSPIRAALENQGVRVISTKIASTTELFQSKEVNEVQARLELALQNEDIFLLTGAVGSGKTSALRYFINNIDPAGYKHVYVPVSKYKFGEIAKHALAGLQMKVPYSTNIAIRKLKQTITSLHKDRNIKVEDTLKVQLLGKEYNLKVSGIAASPEYIYLMENEQTITEIGNAMMQREEHRIESIRRAHAQQNSLVETK